MDERSITAQVLMYLLKNRFHIKAEMARALGIQQRTLEKVFAQLEVAKGSTIALSKALEYCLKYSIPLEPIFQSMVQVDNLGNII